MGGEDTGSDLTQVNRVSIRAVLLPSGEDAAKALVANGIYDPVAIPFTVANEPSFTGATLTQGGLAPTLAARLEMDATEPAPAQRLSQSSPGAPGHADSASPAATSGGTFGNRSLAPVRRPRV